MLSAPATIGAQIRTLTPQVFRAGLLILHHCDVPCLRTALAAIVREHAKISGTSAVGVAWAAT
ncbi:MAG: hypothetical protein ACO3LT_09965, partial [Ilumatobacteraceae bacterium]